MGVPLDPGVHYGRVAERFFFIESERETSVAVLDVSGENVSNGVGVGERSELAGKIGLEKEGQNGRTLAKIGLLFFIRLEVGFVPFVAETVVLDVVAERGGKEAFAFNRRRSGACRAKESGVPCITDVGLSVRNTARQVIEFL